MSQWGTGLAAIGSLFFIWGALAQFIKHDGTWGQRTLYHVEIRWIRYRYGCGIVLIAVGVVLLLLNSSKGGSVASTGQLMNWWIDNQWVIAIGTVASALAAIVMATVSFFQLKYAREEHRKANDAILAAENALKKAEENEGHVRSLLRETVRSYEQSLIASSLTWASFSKVLKKLQQAGVGNFEENLHDVEELFHDFQKELKDLRQRQSEHTVIKNEE